MSTLDRDRQPAAPAAPAADARRSRLYASLIEDAFQFVAVIRRDFVVEMASRPITALLGHDPAEIEGTSVADFVHPDDLERALLHMSGFESFGAPSGNTAFRLRHADGNWHLFDVTAAQVSDGDTDYLAVYCAPVDYQHATSEVLARLLNRADRAAALTPVLDVFSWQLNDSHIAITWTEPGGERRYVSTDLPPALAGATAHPASVWSTAISTRAPVLDIDQGQLEPDVRDLASRHNCGGVWVVPVDDAGSSVPALITVWTKTGGPRPDGHAYGMTIAQTYVELILRWSSQVSMLEHAAHRDALTGLANRRALFDTLEAGDADGALMFCDLDHFKPVNDIYGHAAGDEVLRQIGRRIEQAVRTGDLVARTGGDEFVVLARNATLEQAAALAQRIRSAAAEPTVIDNIAVTVGVTIGVAHARDALTEATLAGADQALMLAKANARGTVRWAPGSLLDPADPAGPADPDGPQASSSDTTTE